MKYYINSYKPLGRTRSGSNLARAAGVEPFVDGSHRREPYLSPSLAAITSLCRGRNFAPRLSVGDIVVYLTVKTRFPGDPKSTRRLPAVLQVTDRFETHLDAAA